MLEVLAARHLYFSKALVARHLYFLKCSLLARKIWQLLEPAKINKLLACSLRPFDTPNYRLPCKFGESYFTVSADYSMHCWDHGAVEPKATFWSYSVIFTVIKCGIFSLYKNYFIYVLKILIYEEYIKQLASSAIVQSFHSVVYTDCT